MEFDYQFSKELNYLRVRASGRLEVGELLKFAQEIRQHPEFIPGMNSIWDLLGTEYHHVEVKDFEEAAEFRELVEEERGTATVVIVVGDDLGFGLSRMFHGHMGHRFLNYVVVRSVPEANKVLGLPG